MMKKVVIALLAAAVCFTAIGCSGLSSGENSDGSVGFSQESTLEESSEQPPEQSQSEEDEFKIPASAKKTETSGLYLFKNGISEYAEMVEADISGDVIRFEYIAPGLYTSSVKVVTYSLTEDKILGSIALPENVSSTGPLDGGGFYALSLITDEVFLYDKYCAVTYHKEKSGSSILWNNASVSGDGKYMLYNRAIDGRLVLYAFSTGSSVEIGSESGSFVPLGYDGGYFYVRNYEKGVMRVSAEKQTLEQVYNGEDIALITTGYASDVKNNYLTLTEFNNRENRRMAPVTIDGEYPVAFRNGLLATDLRNDGRNVMRVYDWNKSVVSPAISVPGYVQKLLFCDKMLLIISHETETASLKYYLYDLTQSADYESVAVVPADNAILNYEHIPEWQGDAATIALAQKTLDTYGVRVFYGADDFNLANFSYDQESVGEEEKYAKMLALYDFLEYFPEGMLAEISGGGETWIYMCGKLKNRFTGGYVSAFALQYVKHPFIAIDVIGSDEIFCETMIHEFSHLIDYRVDIEWLNGWINLMPEDIAEKAYANSYTAATDNSYTPYNDGKTEVWFYSHYSKTFPTEDRAVIFQKMYVSDQEGELTYEFKNHENLRKKAEYYAAMLRDNFESCKNAEVLPWESEFGE